FENKSNVWLEPNKTVSGATAYADLDNDGDLDLVVNNSNQDVSIYINQTNEKSSYLQLKFDYPAPNTNGTGTKVYAYHNGKLQFKELYTVRGFQASSQPIVHFGFGNIKTIDSLKIVWPNQSYQTLKNVSTNQKLVVSPKNTRPFDYNSLTSKTKPVFKKVPDNLGIHFAHEEDNYSSFNRQKLIPYQISDRGPATAIGDLNNDGKDDIYFGGSKFKPSIVFFQLDTAFVKNDIKTFSRDSIVEDVVALIKDFSANGQNDILVGTGGADFYNNHEPLLDLYYTQVNGAFLKHELPEYFENASVIKAHDFDNDGDLDVFIGNNAVSNDFGNMPNSYLLENQEGKFSIIENQPFQKTGMITDAIWQDYNKDGDTDLILVGEWMAPKFFKNTNGKFSEENIIASQLNGLWQRIIAFDMDKDGDTDYLLGNWGTNTKFKATDEHPLKMYYSDFDGNGSGETIVCNYTNGDYYPILGLDELGSQIVSLRKKFTNYKSFAGKPIEDILEPSVLEKTTVLEVQTLSSGYLKNENNSFTFIPFKNELQVSPISAFLKYDFDGNGKEEVLAAGNYFGVQPFHGRFDSFPGALIYDEQHIDLGNTIGLDFSQKAIKHLNIITLNGESFLLTTANNDTAQVYELLNKN
ncbi:FG-GAP-like repeat-containing protein, partial [Psychroserpens sp.]|uniref:FG-GAP-like repeat-containing protein n=1 Tax=Psychroserpens sp. TaxID=2020870 RepID=UPI003C75F031